MAQSSMQNGDTLKRMAIEWANHSTVNLQVNPQQYSFKQGQRTTVFKTQSNTVVEDFGQDIATITFSGHTGFSQHSATGATGMDRYWELRTLLEGYASSTSDGKTPTDNLIFYNYTDEESYIVHVSPDGFEFTRSVDSPLLFNYSVALIVLRPYGTPANDDRADAPGGNNAPSVGGGDVASGNTTGTFNPHTKQDAATNAAQNAIKAVTGAK